MESDDRAGERRVVGAERWRHDQSPLRAPMNRGPLVSVVVPAYNAERTIGATLASIEAQTESDFEVVVVDDGSSDSTVAAAEATGMRGLRVILQANAGHAAARNTGIDAARGRYIAFL